MVGKSGGEKKMATHFCVAISTQWNVSGFPLRWSRVLRSVPKLVNSAKHLCNRASTPASTRSECCHNNITAPPAMFVRDAEYGRSDTFQCRSFLFRGIRRVSPALLSCGYKCTKTVRCCKSLLQQGRQVPLPALTTRCVPRSSLLGKGLATTSSFVLLEPRTGIEPTLPK